MSKAPRLPEGNHLLHRTAEASAMIGELVPPTNLEPAHSLSEETGMPVLLKREDQTVVRSFKVRGALHAVMRLSDDERKHGVLAASAGNHAQGVALAAREMGISATIVMPRTTPPVKIKAVQRLGGNVILEGDSYSDAFEASQSMMQEIGATFVHPFDDPDVIVGQATIAHELAFGLEPFSHVFVPVGGGGLVAGIASYLKTSRKTSRVKVVGVEPEDSNAMQQSLLAGAPVTLEHVGIFADGVAVKRVGDLTFQATQRYINDIITVDNDAIAAAMELFYDDTRAVLEPAGALAIAGVMQYSRNRRLHSTDRPVAICSGANMMFSRLHSIAERSEIGRNRQGLFIVELPEKAGALYRLCQDVINGHKISEFRYRLTDPNKARFMIGIEFADQNGHHDVTQKLAANAYVFDDVSDSSFADYGKHLVGTARHEARRGPESFYEVEFPERPGGLSELLSQIGSRWNISLFQYRNSGGDRGKVLIGFQNPDGTKELERLLKKHTSWFAPVSQDEIDRYSY